MFTFDAAAKSKIDYKWWNDLPRCIICSGKLVHIKCKATNQVLTACVECLAFFPAESVLSKPFTCVAGNSYNNMLGIDIAAWELTEETPNHTWDKVNYFKNIYNPHNNPFATKGIKGDSGVVDCLCCKDLKKFREGNDDRGIYYKLDELRDTELKVFVISEIGQSVQHCRYCDSIWRTFCDPDWRNYGGTLYQYLAMLGIIQPVLVQEI